MNTTNSNDSWIQRPITFRDLEEVMKKMEALIPKKLPSDYRIVKNSLLPKTMKDGGKTYEVLGVLASEGSLLVKTDLGERIVIILGEEVS